MVFSSLTFLYAFLPITLFLYFIVPNKYRNFVLFLVSLFFYSWGEPKYMFIMLASILMNYLFGFAIDKHKDNNRSKAKTYVTICITLNLLLLGFFKYYDFFISNLNHLGLTFLHPLKIWLPIGISFYTFQTMSYPIDLYNNKCSVQRSFIAFGAYVCMFPQLIAGPIVRYTDIAKQLEERTITLNDFYEGILRFVIGLSKKVLLANNFGMIFDEISTLTNNQTTLTAWLGILCYAMQIYFDFSGYSDMAIGLGRMFGFTFLENFNYPYISKSITEFWRRWHMSLSYWFRDYVYIPLGGNRCSTKRQILNIMIVWLLTGFWHGASWNFVLWGVFYGIILLIEKFLLNKYLKNLPSCLQHIYTMFIVLIAWVLFAFTNINDAMHYISLLFGSTKTFANTLTLYYLRNNIVLLIVGLIACTPIAKSKYNPKNTHLQPLIPILVILAMFVCTAFIVDATYNPFLYFRF